MKAFAEALYQFLHDYCYYKFPGLDAACQDGVHSRLVFETICETADRYYQAYEQLQQGHN